MSAPGTTYEHPSAPIADPFCDPIMYLRRRAENKVAHLVTYHQVAQLSRQPVGDLD